MTTESHDLSERTRKCEHAIRQALTRVGQERAAECMGVSRSTVSRMQTEEINRIASFIAALDLKIVPREYRCAKPEVIEACLVLVKAALNQASSHELMWDD